MKVCVYLASSLGNNPVFSGSVKEFGALIGQLGHDLVWGGSDAGCMGILGDSVRKAGGKLIGVGVNIEKIRRVLYRNLDELIMTDNLLERKEKMIALADLFVAFPGSVGTLDELGDVLALIKLRETNCKLLVMNIEGFYNPLKEQLEKMVSCGFMRAEDLDGVIFLDGIEEAKEYLK